jgi:hypothetical protein
MREAVEIPARGSRFPCATVQLDQAEEARRRTSSFSSGSPACARSGPRSGARCDRASRTIVVSSDTLSYWQWSGDPRGRPNICSAQLFVANSGVGPPAAPCARPS